MLLVDAVAFSDVILAIHILAVVIGFGATFAYPLLFSAARRLDPHVLPWLFGAIQRIGRRLINPGLVVVLLSGIYLASDEHQWGAFYVQWGFAAVIALGALEGGFMIPREGRLAEIAARDLAATAVPGGGSRQSAQWSTEFNRIFRQLVFGGVTLELIVVVTVVLMATHAGR